MTPRIDNYEPEDLDLSWGDEDELRQSLNEPAPRKRPRVPVRRRRTIALAIVAIAAFLMTSGLGYGVRGCVDSDRLTQAALKRQELDNSVASRDARITSLETSLTASQTLAEELAAELEDEITRAETYKAYAEEASSTIATLKGQVQQQKTTPKQSAPKVVTASYTPAEGEHGGVWPEAKTASVLAAAADFYGITGADREFIVAKGCYIVYRGAENRDGICDKFNTQGSGARGLFQYMPSWGTGPCPHGASDWRACGTCNCFAFVKVFKDAGTAGLKRQWAATYGG